MAKILVPDFVPEPNAIPTFPAHMEKCKNVVKSSPSSYKIRKNDFDAHFRLLLISPEIVSI